MRLPRKVVLGGYDVSIKHRNGIKVDGKACYGVYDTATRTIYLARGMSPTRKKEIFLHELLHAIEDIYRIDLSEESIGNMSRALFHVLTVYKINLLE